MIEEGLRHLNDRLLLRAFNESVALYREWKDGEPEPTVRLGKLDVPISGICERLLKCEFEMPAELTGSLNLEHGATYGRGAAVLAEMIRAQRATPASAAGWENG